MNPRQIESDAATLQLDNAAVDGTFFDLCFIPDPPEARDFNPDQPRDPNGQFASGAALTENQDGEVKLVGVCATAAGRDDARAAIEAAREENSEAANLQWPINPLLTPLPPRGRGQARSAR
jgi:hypothetical protein